MIIKCNKDDYSKILHIVNDAALKYKGIIPDDCWNDPYMSKKELMNELSQGVQMYGFSINKKLIGVMGIQKVKNIILIRHAYILSSHQGKRIGSKLVEYILRKNQNVRLLVGTWEKATWAIQFYEKFGFILHSKEKTIILLKKYWNISSKQIKNSVVLERF